MWEKAGVETEGCTLHGLFSEMNAILRVIVVVVCLPIVAVQMIFRWLRWL